jgi:hypothetical protein
LNETSPQSPADLLARVQVVETNAQLMMVELRSARLSAEQTAATLSLVLGLLGATREADGGFLVGRIFQDLLLCAEDVQMAARISGCEAELIDPPMIRASAALLSGDLEAVLRGALGEAHVAH